MTTTFVDVDVRAILRAGGEPFGEIMKAVSDLRAGEGLRLLATFKPTPLFQVLGAKGFVHEARELGGGDWEVLFSPSGAAASQPAPSAAKTSDDLSWAVPVRHLDNRDLDPPEPMTRILTAVEAMAPDEVLCALLRREPLFLFPELAKRGHSWRGGLEADGATYKVLVRVGAGAAAS